MFFFYKDPYGFDDRILVKREVTTAIPGVAPEGGITGTGGSRAQEVVQRNRSAGLIPVWNYDVDTPKPQPTPTTTPTQTPANNPGDSTPQV